MYLQSIFPLVMYLFIPVLFCFYGIAGMKKEKKKKRRAGWCCLMIFLTLLVGYICVYYIRSTDIFSRFHFQIPVSHPA